MENAIIVHPVNTYIELAESAENAGELDRSITLAEKASELDPGNDEALYLLGRLLFKNEMPHEALERLEACIALRTGSPGLADAHFFRGRCLMQLGERTGAVAAFELAITLDPGSAAFYLVLGEAMNESGNLAGAERAYKDALALKREAWMHDLLGAVQFSLGKRQEALDSFRSAQEIDPEDFDSCFNIAILTEIDQPEEAHKYYRQATILDPSSAEAFRDLAWLEYRAGNYQGAEESIRRSVELDPEDALAHTYWGAILESFANLTSAEEHYMLACELNPRLSIAFDFIGKLHHSMGKPKEAETELRRAIELDPNMACHLFNLGRFLVEQNRKEEGVHFLEEATRLDPNDRRAENFIAKMPGLE